MTEQDGVFAKDGVKHDDVTTTGDTFHICDVRSTNAGLPLPDTDDVFDLADRGRAVCATEGGREKAEVTSAVKAECCAQAGRPTFCCSFSCC